MKRRNFSHLLHAQEHERGKFSNPYFQERSIKRRKRLRFVFVSSVLILCCAPIAVLSGPWFRVETISTSGLTTIPEEEVIGRIDQFLSQKRFGILSQRNRLFLRTERLKDELQSTYQFSKLEMAVHDRAIAIIVEEKISEVVWVSGDAMYFLDLTGVAVRPLYDYERAQILSRLGHDVSPETVILNKLAPTMPIIFDDSQSPIEAADTPMTSVSIDHIIAFDRGVRILMIHPKTYGIEDPINAWLRADTDMPYDLLFDASLSVDDQLASLEAVLQGQDEILAVEYIDLRFGNQVFVK